MKKIIDTDVQAMGLDDAKVQAKARKAQENAQCIVIDESKRAPQFMPMGVDLVDTNANRAEPANSKTSPAQGFRKEPTKIVQGLE
jgi:hypothetical protein